MYVGRKRGVFIFLCSIFLLQPTWAVKANHLGTEQNDSRLVKSPKAQHILSFSQLIKSQRIWLVKWNKCKGEGIYYWLLWCWELSCSGHVSEVSIETVSSKGYSISTALAAFWGKWRRHFVYYWVFLRQWSFSCERHYYTSAKQFSRCNRSHKLNIKNNRLGIRPSVTDIIALLLK